MPKKKLTKSLREKLKKDYSKVRLKDYSGEALTYLRKIRGAAKGRKVQKGKKAKVGKISIPRDSDLYRIIEKAAKLKKMSVAAFIKKYKSDIDKLLKNGEVMLDRETDKLISDINRMPSGTKVFINDGNGYVRVGRNVSILDLQLFKQFIASETSIFMLFFRAIFKLSGDIYFWLPDRDEYLELAGSEEDIIEMLDSYYPWISYLISPKKRKNGKGKGPGKSKPVKSKISKTQKGKKAGKSIHRKKR